MTTTTLHTNNNASSINHQRYTGGGDKTWGAFLGIDLLETYPQFVARPATPVVRDCDT